MNFLLKQIIHLVEIYQNEYPLASFLRDYYRTQPQLGSRDRRAINEAMFLYYRTSYFLHGIADIPTRLAYAYSLCNSSNAFLKKMLPEIPGNPPAIQQEPRGYPQLSDGILRDEWLSSILHQPRVFIRILRDEQRVLRLLLENQIVFEEIQVLGPNRCLAMPNSAPIDKIIPAELYVVQDWSSQKALLAAIGNMMHSDAIRKVWDTCAGAGGKSLLLYQVLPGIELTASDVRKSILSNLSDRFRLYQYPLPRLRVADLTVASETEEKYDLVVCDVPCSGSGTWARTPEQFHFFQNDDMKKFADLQFPILANCSKSVRKGGYLAYITCSVFQEENENVVDSFLASHPEFQLVKAQLTSGLVHQADVLFSATFSRK